MTIKKVEQIDCKPVTSGYGYNIENSFLRFKPYVAFQVDDGASAVGTGSTGLQDSKPTEAPVNQSTQTEIKNPDGLLKAYEATKEELKTLKEFKATIEREKQQLEAKRLEEKGQYEKALELKINEALTPVNQSLEQERKAKEKLAKDAQTWQEKYLNLEKEVKTEKLKNGVNQLFLSSEAQGDKDAIDLFWAKYGNQFTLSDDGKPVLSDGSDPLEFIKGLHKDPGAKRLFLANIPEGSGTNPQTGSSKGSGVKPVVMTAAEQMKSKDPKILQKIISGEIKIVP